MQNYNYKELSIKGMVCDRCIRVVRNELEKLEIQVVNLKLGTVTIKYSKDLIDIETIDSVLRESGFEIIRTIETKLVEQVKRVIIKITSNLPIVMNMKLSVIISDELQKDYSVISKLFSSVEKLTIEKYFIQLKIEKAKELIQNNQLNFTQIAYELGYSSVNYLSNQFKQITGMSMSDYKKLSHWDRKGLDKIL
jgi:AraC family transcriptional regulator